MVCIRNIRVCINTLHKGDNDDDDNDDDYENNNNNNNNIDIINVALNVISYYLFSTCSVSCSFLAYSPYVPMLSLFILIPDFPAH